MIDFNKKQNEWAEDNSSDPYVSPEMQIKMWRDNDPKSYKACIEKVDNPENKAGGLNKPNGEYTGQMARTDALRKDLTINKTRPQRPTDFTHLKKLIMESDGVFNHAKAGHILTATRKDGTISVWDHWHTSLFAYLAGIDYLRIDNYNHEDNDLEKARMLEQEFFYSKNGLAKKVSEHEEHEKNVERQRRLIREKKAPSFNIDVAIDDIMTKTGLSATGRLVNNKKLNGILSFKNTYKKIRSYYKGQNPDKIFINSIKQITKVWPNDEIKAYFLEGYCDLKQRIDEHLPNKVTETDWQEFLDSLAKFGEKQTSFTTVDKDSGKAKNEKGKATESISLRLLYHFNNWWKRPESPHIQVLVNQAKALKMYNNDLTDLYIKATIKGARKSIEVECPNCQHDFKHTIEE